MGKPAACRPWASGGGAVRVAALADTSSSCALPTATAADSSSVPASMRPPAGAVTGPSTRLRGMPASRPLESSMRPRASIPTLLPQRLPSWVALIRRPLSVSGWLPGTVTAPRSSRSSAAVRSPARATGPSASSDCSLSRPPSASRPGASTRKALPSGSCSSPTVASSPRATSVLPV